MTTPVLLNNIDHADVRVATGFGARYGDAVNQTAVLPSEFEALQREYVIVFRRNAEGAYRAVVLLGLDADENLYLDGERWDARYVPALHARGPFSIHAPPDGEPMIHIDVSHSRVGAVGEPIFREHGGNAPLLDHVSAVLQVIYAGSRIGPSMIDRWSELDLLAPVTLRLDLDDSRRYSVPDCYTIDTTRLAALGGAALDRLHQADLLRPAFWVASSLGNVSYLLDRKLRRDGTR